MVMKLPPTARVSILEARIAFKQTMVHSNLTDNLVAPLMYALRIKNRQLGDLTGRVVRRVQASNPGGVSKGRMRSSHSQTDVLQLT